MQRRYKITGFAELTRKANLEKPEEKLVAKLDLGMDVSHYQKNIDWRKVKASGVGFAINKCTEATNYLDPTFADYKKNIQSNGMVWGCYHFARGGDVKKEADWFLRNIGEVKTGDILVLDWEIQHKDPVGWCSDFIDIVTKKTGLKPFLYTNEARIKQYSWDKVAKKSLLWAAKYGINNGEPQKQPVGGAWGKPTIWQFSSVGKVNGISGNVDLNKWLS
jgi:GH25 family lysozyme M1 (1,4-beta-N-acetylmuramidase)